MSLISELRAARALFEAAEARLKALEEDPQLKAVRAFEEELRALMAKHSMSLVDVNSLMDPNYKLPKMKPGDVKPKTAGTAKDRPTIGADGKAVGFRRYTNPHTGEVIDHYRGPHAVLSEWKMKWGDDVVKGWGVKVKPE